MKKISLIEIEMDIQWWGNRGYHFGHFHEDLIHLEWRESSDYLFSLFRYSLFVSDDIDSFDHHLHLNKGQCSSSILQNSCYIVDNPWYSPLSHEWNPFEEHSLDRVMGWEHPETENANEIDIKEWHCLWLWEYFQWIEGYDWREIGQFHRRYEI